MRIKSSGPGASQNVRGAKGVAKTSGAKFSGLVDDRSGGETEERARQVRNALLEELSELAKDLENGKATKEEASRRFALMVIRDRFGDPARTKGGQNMTEAIGDLVENDPNFVARLQDQLKKLSKS
jgi:hypothetical protein